MTQEPERQPIGTYKYIKYDRPEEVFQLHDPRAPEVAARVAAMIRQGMSEVTVEHVGSTAIPGCAGKGVIDLMVLYAPGKLAEARDRLDAMGFQRHTGSNAFPEERPVRIGTIEHDGTTFRLHAHVLAEDSPEVKELRRFRDTLRADPALMEEYVARKRAIAESGISTSDDYMDAKDPFIREVLASTARTSGGDR